MRKMSRTLKDILKGTIPSHILCEVYNSYDIVGDIAVIKVTKNVEAYREQVAWAIMKIHKNVKTVLAQISPVEGEYRLRRLEYIAGEAKTVTIHKEHGCLFSVDLAKCYFSPRLSYERLRIAKLVKTGEVIVNMFAGVGCFSIVIAKHSEAKEIYSIDINPIAVKFMKKNIVLNKVNDRVIPIEGDAKEVIINMLSKKADRVLMPLPEKAIQYLPYAALALKEGGGYIHYYDFEHAGKGEDPIKKALTRVESKLRELGFEYSVCFGRIVRTTGPNWYQVALDISIKGT